MKRLNDLLSKESIKERGETTRQGVKWRRQQNGP